MAHLNFEALRDLHESANHLLHSPVIKQFLVHHGKWIDDVSEASLTMLDVCSTSMDVLLLVKDNIQDLRVKLRRSNSSDPGEDINPVTAYNIIKRKLKKEMVKCLRSLKRMKSGSDGLDLLPVDQGLNVVVDVLREVKVTIVAIVGSISTLVSIPWLEGKSTTRNSLAMKLMRSRDWSLSGMWVDRTALESAGKRLEAVEIAIEDLEIELECMFRRLIQTRVSLLNILTY